MSRNPYDNVEGAPQLDLNLRPSGYEPNGLIERHCAWGDRSDSLRDRTFLISCTLLCRRHFAFSGTTVLLERLEPAQNAAHAYVKR
jgi:hypothetical protein